MRTLDGRCVPSANPCVEEHASAVIRRQSPRLHVVSFQVPPRFGVRPSRTGVCWRSFNLLGFGNESLGRRRMLRVLPSRATTRSLRLTSPSMLPLGLPLHSHIVYVLTSRTIFWAVSCQPQPLTPLLCTQIPFALRLPVLFACDHSSIRCSSVIRSTRVVT